MKDEIFKNYVSNTHAAFCIQNAFYPEDSEKSYTGRVFYRLFAGGEYNYRLYFGNTVDSTFGEGQCCHPNEVCSSWHIESCRVGICPLGTDIKNIEFDEMTTLTFGGQKHKHVMPGEIFYSDDAKIKAEKNDYLCLEITFRGAMIPHLTEACATIPTFVKTEKGWQADVNTPGAFLVGCDRMVKKHIAFLGDSITMGCGTTPDKYEYWAARIGDMIGEEYAWWNLGIGFARSSDAATDGAWLYKAKQADFVNVCLGTNDLIRNADPDGVVDNLHRIVDKLNEAGCEVGLFTSPPFNMQGENAIRWDYANKRIRAEFPDKVKYLFDLDPILDKGGEEHGVGKYQPHPDGEGCRILAEKFVEFITSLNEKQ